MNMSRGQPMNDIVLHQRLETCSVKSTFCECSDAMVFATTAMTIPSAKIATSGGRSFLFANIAAPALRCSAKLFTDKKGAQLGPSTAEIIKLIDTRRTSAIQQ